MTESTLDNIRVVLVEPSHPGNIGAVARAMKTMGLGRLVLVGPRGFPSAEATARASGADDVLYRAAVVDELPTAVADCRLVLGTSARRRTLEWPELTAREAARVLLGAAVGGPVAVVFGRERTGLTNAELERCQFLLRIPANPAYTSLNLAAAVQVVAYELWAAAMAGEDGGTATAPGEAATAAELEGLLAHFEETAVQVGFLDPAEPKLLMRRLWRLVNRARLDRSEVNILRGFLKAAQRAARRG
jgi:TrmH family RNA methyltransferase